MTCKNCGHHFSWDKQAVRLEVAGIQNRGMCCRLGWNALARFSAAWYVEPAALRYVVESWWNPRTRARMSNSLVAHRAILVAIAFALFILGGWAVQWAWLCVVGVMQVVGSGLCYVDTTQIVITL